MKLENPIKYYLEQDIETRLLFWQCVTGVVVLMFVLELAMSMARDQDYAYLRSRADVLEDRLEQYERSRIRVVEEQMRQEKKLQVMDQHVIDLYRQQNQIISDLAAQSRNPAQIRPGLPRPIPPRPALRSPPAAQPAAE